MNMIFESFDKFDQNTTQSYCLMTGKHIFHEF